MKNNKMVQGDLIFEAKFVYLFSMTNTNFDGFFMVQGHF